jgi:hypothetical protein
MPKDDCIWWWFARVGTQATNIGLSDRVTKRLKQDARMAQELLVCTKVSESHDWDRRNTFKGPRTIWYRWFLLKGMDKNVLNCVNDLVQMLEWWGVKDPDKTISSNHGTQHILGIKMSCTLVSEWLGDSVSWNLRHEFRFRAVRLSST